MRLLLRLGFALVAAAITGCVKKESPPVEAAAPKLRKVVLQTDWFPQAEHGGFYQALAKGFYREAGLDVEIAAGGPGVGIKLRVAKGEADFGMLKSDDVMVAAARGLPFMMVMATMQRDPQGIMVHEDSPVKSLRDLDGRTVIASVSMTWIPYLQKRLGIQFDVKPNTYGLGEFLANKEAVQQCFVTSEPFFAQQHGRRVRTLLIADSGYNAYHAVFTRRDVVRESPEMVRAFVAASVRGWHDYLEGDPEPANRLILERNKQMSPELLKYSRSQMIVRGLVHGDPAKGEEIGQLSFARLAAEMQTLVDLKILDVPLSIASVATKEFVPRSAR